MSCALLRRGCSELPDIHDGNHDDSHRILLKAMQARPQFNRNVLWTISSIAHAGTSIEENFFEMCDLNKTDVQSLSNSAHILSVHDTIAIVKGGVIGERNGKFTFIQQIYNYYIIYA